MDGAAAARSRNRADRDPGELVPRRPPADAVHQEVPEQPGFVNPRDIEEMWRDQFDWVYREYDYAVFPITIHPDVSGRPHVLMMLERLYHHMIGHPGVRFVTMNEMADDFARRSPRKL
jgi:peptidoglycan/xylan/chitin deacetylase (PgdA/CDA1 family)